jgi:putative ABC transport system permease protein
LLATLGTVFGALALGLVAIGLYATFSGMVSRRTREIGIRMAIGANASRIARLLAREAAIIALSGLGVGMAAAIAAASGIRHQLFNVAPTDARVLAAATVVLVAATAMAVSIPALRAVRIRAVDAIRVE